MNKFTSEEKAILSKSSSILREAIIKDGENHFEEATKLYKEGVNETMKIIHKRPAEETAELRASLGQYVDRFKVIDEILFGRKCLAPVHQQIDLKNDDIGHSYATLFGKYLNVGVTRVTIKDPYIRQSHQILFLVSFLELLKANCKYLKHVKLITGEGDQSQLSAFDEIQRDLKDNYKVQFEYEFSPTLHDRRITLDNSFVFKLGRGLEIFKKPTSRFVLGTSSQLFRKCYETTIDICHESLIKP